jgi:Protein of unknown function (DUF4235)
VAKLLFRPFGILSGILAGIVGRRSFDALWRRVDRTQPPRPDERVGFGKLALALALEGAIFRVARGLIDHAARRGFRKLTGAWPGKERSDADSRVPPRAAR